MFWNPFLTLIRRCAGAGAIVNGSGGVMGPPGPSRGGGWTRRTGETLGRGGSPPTNQVDPGDPPGAGKEKIQFSTAG